MPIIVIEFLDFPSLLLNKTRKKRLFKRFILFLLVSILFISCPDPYFDMSSVHCELDKETYKKDEYIKLTCYGDFDEHDEVKAVYIHLHIYKEINDIYKHVSADDFTIKSYGNFVEDTNRPNVIGYLVYYIKKDEKLTEFNDSIILSISKGGNYRLEIRMEGESDKYQYGGTKFFTFPITITD